MHPTLVEMLIAYVTLAAATVLHASRVSPVYPFPYSSTYTLTYSYVHPPLTLSQSLDMNLRYSAEIIRSGAVLGLQSLSRGAHSLEGTFSIKNDSEDAPNNQSTPKPTCASEEPTPIPASFKLPLPAAAEHVSSTLAPEWFKPLAATSTEATSIQASNELKYYQRSFPITYTILLPLASQHHQQEHFGSYSYGYVNRYNSKHEPELLDGITRGAYNYIDAEGKLQIVSYVSDGQGFLVAATNLPQSNVEIADSAKATAAKAAHLQVQAVTVANVNRAYATAVNGEANASGDNVVAASCNESSGAEATSLNEM